MALADSSRAIGAVTGLLTERIEHLTSHNVTVGRPEPPSANGGIENPRVNLFLYEALFDPHLKNTPLDEGQEAPLWLVLRYLVTPFDETGESDTTGAFSILGDGLRALQALAYLPVTALSAEDQAALDANPEQLTVTFGEASSSLLSNVMQGSEEKYRFSMTFEVRPVMIAPVSPAAYSLLVGIDYTAPPPGLQSDGGVAISVEPTLGSVIERVTPTSFRAGDPPVRIEGRDLDQDGLQVQLGPVLLPLTRDAAGNRVFDPTTATLGGDAISAASHPLSVLRTLSTGRKRASNLVVVNLLPALSAVTHVPADPQVPEDLPELDLRGFHLGAGEDDTIVALYRDGATVRSFDDVVDAPGAPPAQTHRRARLGPPALPAGAYRVIVRVNGQQARESPEVTIP